MLTSAGEGAPLERWQNSWQALLLHAPGSPQNHVSAEVAVPALRLHTGPAGAAAGSSSARSGPRLLDDTGGVSNAEGCGWIVARSGGPTGTLADETPGTFPLLLGSQSLTSYPGRQGTRRCPYCGESGVCPLPLGKAILFLKQLTWLLREP